MELIDDASLSVLKVLPDNGINLIVTNLSIISCYNTILNNMEEGIQANHHHDKYAISS